MVRHSGNGCQTPHIPEEDIKARFLTAFNILMNDRQGLIDDCRMAQTALCDTSAIDIELTKVRSELGVVSELSRKAIYENARTAMSQSEWSGRDISYLEHHKQASQRLEELEAQKRERLGKGKILEGFIRDIQSRELAITEFDEKLWLAAIDKVTVSRDDSMTFRFRNGQRSGLNAKYINQRLACGRAVFRAMEINEYNYTNGYVPYFKSYCAYSSIIALISHNSKSLKSTCGKYNLAEATCGNKKLLSTCAFPVLINTSTG